MNYGLYCSALGNSLSFLLVDHKGVHKAVYSNQTMICNDSYSINYPHKLGLVIYKRGFESLRFSLMMKGIG